MPGAPGHRYSVRLTNTSGERLLVVLSVDGVNAISGQTAAPAGAETQTVGQRQNNTTILARGTAPASGGLLGPPRRGNKKDLPCGRSFHKIQIQQ